jgi:Recombination endonuclease VII
MSTKEKEYQRNYHKTYKYKKARKLYDNKYKTSQKGKDTEQRYRQSPTGKEALRKYRQLPKTKKYIRSYHQKYNKLPKYIEYQQKFKESHPEYGKKYTKSLRGQEIHRKHHLKNYGMDTNDYNDLLREQHGKCAICSKPPKGDRNLCIDHNHNTGKIRGLLCQSCNLILGHSSDSICILQKAIKYLKNY